MQQNNEQGNKYVQVILISTDWSLQHRKHLLIEYFHTSKKWADNVIIQQPVCLLGHLFTQFKRKIIGLFKGKYRTIRIENDAWLYTPVIIFNYALWLKFPMLAKIDSFMMKVQINRFVRKNFSLQKVIFWVFYPCHLFLTESVKHDYLVYDFYDNFDFHPDGALLPREKLFNDRLITESDLVLCLSKITYQRAYSINKNTRYFRSGNDFETISNSEKKEIPGLLNNKTKVIGFLGNIRHWMDFGLLDKLINDLPNYYFVFIGFLNRDSKNSFNKLLQYSNVICFPYMEQREAASYLKRFNVGIIPFKINDFMKGVFPNKFLEYMAAGVPTVTTALPDLEEYRNIIGFAKSNDEFVNQCRSAAEGEYDQYKGLYRKIASENSWQHRSTILNDIVIHTLNLNFDSK